MKINFTGKTVLVTGATRGIGKTIAERFASLEANLLATGTKELARYSDDVQKFFTQNNVTYMQADFAKPESTTKFLESISKNSIDICVNNAGLNIVNKFEEISTGEFEYINKVNLNSPFQILSVVLPQMEKANYGRVVNIASIWSVVSRSGRTSYSVSKHALVGLTKSLSAEYASRNVLINTISPGFTLTELTKSTNTQEELNIIKDAIPMGRLANPIEIANAVIFLCSDYNTYLTGQNIVVDGGYTNV